MRLWISCKLQPDCRLTKHLRVKLIGWTSSALEADCASAIIQACMKRRLQNEQLLSTMAENHSLLH